MQRYKFESNSQPVLGLHTHHHVAMSDAKIQIWKQFTTWRGRSLYVGGCNVRCKDTNLKAIHNLSRWLPTARALQCPMQRYKFESNSQPAGAVQPMAVGCNVRCKDTNLKAIHNRPKGGTAKPGLQCPMQRYKFESNSQHLLQNVLRRASCNVRCKDTNLKAIHNALMTVRSVNRLQCPMQRYKFESNSQLANIA